ncbi:MAG: hypothetical protein IJP13_01410 [Lachnospiraceae bacterium]|nr:hypothetical protein [Lachnospiraceae bacterium]
MFFDKDEYEVDELTIGDESVTFRGFYNKIYVTKPVDKLHQQLHIFAPEAYYRGEGVNGYSIGTAPILVMNMMDGYEAGELAEPGEKKTGPAGNPNAVFSALQRGYVVVIPALRSPEKEPLNSIVDFKAAVKYLRYFAVEIPGDKNKIITNGKNIGGALSVLMGATGNHYDYESYFEEIGAVNAIDEVYASACYWPVSGIEKLAINMKMLDPMNYIYEPFAVTTRNWHIRHEQMREETLEELVKALERAGCSVDYCAGDSDISQMFDWIDSICK